MQDKNQTQKNDLNADEKNSDDTLKQDEVVDLEEKSTSAPTDAPSFVKTTEDKKASAFAEVSSDAKALADRSADKLADEEEEDKKAEETADEGIVINKSKLYLISQLIENIKENNDRLIKILSTFAPKEDEALIRIRQDSDKDVEIEEEDKDGKVIEGVFDGENMIGPDGKEYSVPSNYASKSKLVEGDILKLIITVSGTFIYKQIGPIERDRVVGELKKDTEGNFLVEFEGKKWRVLPASVTYFKGSLGDKVVILIPKTGESQWGAVENIIRERGE